MSVFIEFFHNIKINNLHLNMYLVKSPFLLKWYYPSLTWNKTRKEKVIYLTFDDGPIPDVTPFVLKTLKDFNAKATFFCIGDNIRKHPEIFRQLKKEGHQIGNHTFNHLKGWKTADDMYLDNFEKCQAQTNIIMWDVLSGDFDIKLSPEKCYENVINNTRNGSIIVFHDSLKAFDRL